MLKIYGLTRTELAQLKHIAHQKNGSENLSLFGREIFRQMIAEYQEITQPESLTISNKEMENTLKDKRVRVVIRLTESEKAIFEKAAVLHKMSLNTFLRQLLRYHIDKVKTMTRLECETIYQSQINIVRMGYFLNEIVKNMKTTGAAAVSIKQMERFHAELKEHMKKVGDILSKSQERF